MSRLVAAMPRAPAVPVTSERATQFDSMTYERRACTTSPTQVFACGITLCANGQFVGRNSWPHVDGASECHAGNGPRHSIVKSRSVELSTHVDPELQPPPT